MGELECRKDVRDRYDGRTRKCVVTYTGRYDERTCLIGGIRKELTDMNRLVNIVLVYDEL